MPQPQHVFARHYLVDFTGCHKESITRARDVKKALFFSAKLARATIIRSYFKQYKPAGVTGVILIAESHFSIHTWPEKGYVALDILTCGKMLPEKAIHFLQKAFKAEKTRKRLINRGY